MLSPDTLLRRSARPEKLPAPGETVDTLQDENAHTENNMAKRNIAFIGGGNMARSLIGGLIVDGYPADRIWVSDPAHERLGELGAQFAVHAVASNREATAQAEVIVLATKPDTVRRVATELAATLGGRRPLILSVAAGVRVADLAAWLGDDSAAIVRAMPNTPALIRTGASALYANAHASAAQRDLAESLLRAVGITCWLDDEQAMDAATAISGSGPAYFFLLMEALEAAGLQLGLPAGQTRLLVLQTALGAAKMALESDAGPAGLRRQVTSPGGTTEAAISALHAGQFGALIQQAATAAATRADELGKTLGE
jgi:pyrroline-5-carboxylate reductase